MLRTTEDIRNYVLEAQDGEIGSVKDFMFDDEKWTIRYMVADTGDWLPGRKVLISPALLGHPNATESRLPVSATREKIENSPPLEVDKPVNRDYEQRWHDYYGWTYYWSGVGLWGTGMGSTDMNAASQARGYYASQMNPKVSNLESTSDVSGFHVQAADGEIGHVEDFVFDDEDWSIRYIVVDTRNWLPGKKVLVSSRWFKDVNWADETIRVELSRKAIENSPEYDSATLNRGYEARLHQHYGLPPYWEE